MSTLASDGSTVISLQRQIDELAAKLDTGSECHVSRQPCVRSITESNPYTKECAALVEQLKAAITKIPAKVHVFITAFADEDNEIWLDVPRAQFSVMHAGEEYTVDLSRVEEYWLSDGHRL